MSCCGLPNRDLTRDETVCPECGTLGKRVKPETLRALLLPPAAADIKADRSYRFCGSRGCPVVYFDARQVFRCDALSVPVHQKEHDDNVPVCYCFGISPADVRGEIDRTGGSTVIAEITRRVRAGECACERTNPQGSCCLGNVGQVVNRLLRRPSDRRTAAPILLSAPGE